MKYIFLLLSSTIFSSICCSVDKRSDGEESSNLVSLAKSAKDSTESLYDEPYKPHKVTLSNCQTVHKHNLETDDTIINYVTVNNKSAQSVKGIEVMTNKFDEIKIKINIPPHSSKRIEAKGFDCSSSDVSGIFYTNGKYEEQQWSVSTSNR